MISASALVSSGSHISNFRTLPGLLNEANVIGNTLQAKSNKQIKDIYGLSAKLTSHVTSLCREFQTIKSNASVDDLDINKFSQAAAMFNGPAFQGLDQGSLNDNDKELLQQHLRILTGLYGDVKPFDTIQEHRLCMSTKLNVDNKKDLYSYWGDSIAINIVKDIHVQLQDKNKRISNVLPLIINCASQEYYKAISSYLEKLELKNQIMIVECVFLDKGMIKSAYAKRARGLMARYVCTHGGINSSADVDLIKEFNSEGYKFSSSKSSANRYVFDRNAVPTLQTDASQSMNSKRKTKSASIADTVDLSKQIDRSNNNDVSVRKRKRK